MIPVVNESDVIVGYKDREDIQQEDIYRVSALLIVDENDNILVTRRALTKKNEP